MKRQTGFTLIELAIVLVIIGLLLGGVLKGQELINSAKVKNYASDLKNIQVYIYGYQDKYKALPGDDLAANTHLNGGTVAIGAANSVGNGVIDGQWDSTVITDESFLFWQHVRLAGLASGSTNTAVAATFLPRNADGGPIGVQSLNGFTTISGFTSGSYVACTSSVAGSLALQIDTTLDDGDPTTGSVRAVPSTAARPTAPAAILPANFSSLYTVCITF